MSYKQNQDLNQDLQNPTLVFSEGKGLGERGRDPQKQFSLGLPSLQGCTGVSMEDGGIQDPEVNLARLLNKPSGDPSSGLPKLRCNRKSSEPRESGELRSSPVSATDLSHDPGQVNFLFEPPFPHLDSIINTTGMSHVTQFNSITSTEHLLRTRQ